MPANLIADCQVLRLPLDVLSNPLGAEGEDGPAADALRRSIDARVPAGEDPPTDTYRILLETPDQVLYGSGGEVIDLISVTRTDDRWSARVAGTCTPILELPGLQAARWNLPVDWAAGHDTRRFTALVSEVTCGDGQPAGDRVLPPIVKREPTRVLVIFGIVPPAGPAPVACPGVVPTNYEVDLGEPLGARELLDGGTIPPDDPFQPSCCG